MLRPSANDGERLRREHQQSTGKQGNQCEDIEVHAIGTRQPCGRSNRSDRTFGVHARGQQVFEHALDLHEARPGSQLQIDASETTLPTHSLLNARDVHHSHALARTVRAQESSHSQAHIVQPDLQRDGVTLLHPEPLPSGRTQKNRIRSQGINEIAGLRQECGLDLGGPKNVQPHDPQWIILTRDACIDLDQRTRHRHLRKPGKLWIERLVEAHSRTAHRQVGISRKRLQRAAEFVDRSLVDELDGVPERHPERDREDRDQHAPLVLPERGEKEGDEGHDGLR